MTWFSKPNQPPQEEPPRETPPTQPHDPSVTLNCTFCGKTNHEVRKLIAGPEVYICDECVVLCDDILKEDVPKREPLVLTEAGQLLGQFDELVVGLRGAKRSLVSALRQHVLRLIATETALPPLRLLLVGPTGCGKTTLGRALCTCSPVPSYHADVGRLSESGYVGEDIENLLASLIQAANEDVELAQQGVLFLDGLETIRADRPVSNHRDISGESVQLELLRLFDALPCQVPVNHSRRHPHMQSYPFVADRMLIAGALRLEAAELPPNPTDRELRDVLRSSGFRGEFLARFDRVMLLGRPEEDELMAILENNHGLVAETYRAVEALGGTLKIEPEALRHLAKAASTDQDGAWALARPIQRYLEEIFTAATPNRAWWINSAMMESLIVGSSDEAQARQPYR